MRTKKDIEKVRVLVDRRKYLYCRNFKVAMQGLLTEKESKGLEKKQRYFNPQEGINLGSTTPRDFFMDLKPLCVTLPKVA